MRRIVSILMSLERDVGRTAVFLQQKLAVNLKVKILLKNFLTTSM